MSDINEMKLRQLDFSLLLIFQEVYRSRRLTAAAKRLGLSQPAISHALGRLRRTVEDPLFVRGPNGLRPTSRAAGLAPKVDAILSLAAEALNGPATFDPQASRRLFRISVNDFVGTLLTEPLISLFARTAPSARLALSFAGGPGFAFKKLRENGLDLAIGRFPNLPDDCTATRLFEESYLAVARPGHPQLRQGLDLDAYLAAGHLIVSFAGDLVGTIDEYLSRKGLSRHVIASTPMFLTGFAAASKSDLLVTAPKRLVERYAANFGLQVFELPFAPGTFFMDVIRSEYSRSDPALDWLVENMISLLK
jgi:LysR family transcriptional regulator, mexEF-oprN operon transcriptional activator